MVLADAAGDILKLRHFEQISALVQTCAGRVEVLLGHGAGLGVGAGAAEFVGAAEALLIDVILDGLALFGHPRVLFVHNILDGRGRAVRLAKPLGFDGVRAVFLRMLLHHGEVGVLDSDLAADGLAHRILILAGSRFGLCGDLVQTLEILVVDPLLLGNQVSGNPLRSH